MDYFVFNILDYTFIINVLDWEWFLFLTKGDDMTDVKHYI